MDDWRDYGEVINDLNNRLTRNQQLLKSIMSQVEKACKENDMSRRITERLASNADLQDIKRQISLPVIFAIADGREVDEHQAKKLDMQKYDVIMDIPEECLKIKRKQKRKFTFDWHDLNLLGPKRFALLQYMLEHPKTTVSINNIYEVPKYGAGLSPNSLSKAKKDLCDFLPQTADGQSYIISTHVISAHRGIEQTTGYGYKINPCYRCMVIWEKF